jgi:hypothetical protein
MNLSYPQTRRSGGRYKPISTGYKGFVPTHGESRTQLYRTWIRIRQRCHYPKFTQWDDYGGRGITVCDEWLNDFPAFRDWALANGYDPHLTIERKNNDGNYEPSNCDWIPLAEQAKNRRRRRWKKRP